jgi:ferrous iron transport protein B
MIHTEKKALKLSDIKTGNSIVIGKILGNGSFRNRISEMGFIRGKTVTVVKNAPLQDPIEYKIMGYNVSLRRKEAELIEVLLPEDAKNMLPASYEGVVFKGDFPENNSTKKAINIALVGNPNSGKTTLFNYASGSRERVGNYSGVTIEAKEAKIHSNGYVINIVDLPGTYSITEYTPEELYVRSHLITKKPDIVINVVDASNLERNLFLTTQLIDMNAKVIIALNMYDEMEQKGARLAYNQLGAMLGIPIIPMVAVKGTGVKDLVERIIRVYRNEDKTTKRININYGESIENAISRISVKIRALGASQHDYPVRYLAIKLLEKDNATTSLLNHLVGFNELEELIRKESDKLEKEYNEKIETIITNAKYGFIAGALKETYTESETSVKKKIRNLDDVLTHKIWGFPIFIFFMWLMFQATFTVGSYPMDWIDVGVGYIANLVGNIMPEGALHDLIVDGIIGGVGGVIIFLPNILILFFFISLMEDTGYMARVSFIMDKLMHKIGLHGKSFIPLIMGFGCNVPAVMATRTLASKKDRILTMLIVPFMSCSARLPVYVLIISAFFLKYQGLVLLSIYIVGIILAVLVSMLFKHTLFRKQEAPFVMELPPYRIPTLKSTILHMWHKAVQYLRKMGTVILMASILIWALSYYPRNINYSTNYDAQIEQTSANNKLSNDEKNTRIANLELMKESERQEKSYIGKMGHLITPVIEPLGFDWKIGVSILTGLAAKEIVVSSMGILYQADISADENSSNLINKLQQQQHTSGELKGQKVFSPLVAYGFMIFVLIYFPCVAVIAGIRKESDWKWAFFTMGYTTLIAWLAAFGIYQIGSLF